MFWWHFDFFLNTEPCGPGNFTRYFFNLYPISANFVRTWPWGIQAVKFLGNLSSFKKYYATLKFKHGSLREDPKIWNIFKAADNS